EVTKRERHPARRSTGILPYECAGPEQQRASCARFCARLRTQSLRAGCPRSSFVAGAVGRLKERSDGAA
ncbi:MAG: hypothetical protein L0H70_04630, partial [Xanthomonadales bacterium]|nr:hypothetical protein [Xanthomonadales bacterium]